MPRKQTDTVHLKLRFSEKLRRRIEAAAGRNQQSMNTEIIHRLEESFLKETISDTVTASVEASTTAVLSQFVVVLGPDGMPMFQRVQKGDDDDKGGKS